MYFTKNLLNCLLIWGPKIYLATLVLIALGESVSTSPAGRAQPPILMLTTYKKE